MILPSQRHLFDIPDGICYLNCSYMSPQLRSVRGAGEKAVSTKSRPWEVTPTDFFEESERARELFARIVGGDAEGVAILPSVSYGMAVATANVSVQRGQNIVVLAEQFPSNVYPWRELAKQRDAELVTVPPARGPRLDLRPAGPHRRKHRRRVRPKLPLDGRLAGRPGARRRTRPRSRGIPRRGRHTVTRGASTGRNAGEAGLPHLCRLQVAARTVQHGVYVRGRGLPGRNPDRAELDRTRGQRRLRPARRLPRRLCARGPTLRRGRAEQLRPAPDGERRDATGIGLGRRERFRNPSDG